MAPAGYGDLLRALALWGRADDWANLRLMFLPDRLWLSYGRRGHRQESVLTRENVDAVLDTAYRCRRDPYAPLSMPMLAQPAPREPGPWTVSRAEPYARDLARVGRFLDRERAAEALVAETDAGFLALAVGTDGLQRARLVDPAAARGWGWRSAGECEAALAALGGQLDATGGHHPLTGIRPSGDWLLCSTVAQEPRVVSGDPLPRSRKGQAA